MSRLWGTIAVLACLPVSALAQDDDRDFLTAFLEDNLSDAGREVIVTGFTGALSSQAHIDALTIADAAGVWLTLTDVTLDWNRAALFSGEVSVNALTAAEIVLTRMPDMTATGPTPEAAGFALPDLPVSVDIGLIEAAHIVLGPEVLGEAVEGRLSAGMALAGGEGRAHFTLERSDGTEGHIALEASYANANRQLVLDLSASEAAAGIAVRLLRIPGAPAAELTIVGAGPLERFTAKVALRTDGVDRLAGEVALTGDGLGQNAFAADLAGDLAPLFLPGYADFFGPEVRLLAKGNRSATGRLEVTEFDLSAQAVTLSGGLALGADGVPERFNLTGRLGLPGEVPLLLPLAADLPLRITGADINLVFDARNDAGWVGDLVLRGLQRADFTATQLRLSGSGRIARFAGGPVAAGSVVGGPVVGGTLAFSATGLAPANPDLAAALGPVVTGSAIVHWRGGQGGLSLSRLQITGQDYDVALQGRLAGLDQAFAFSGGIQARMGDLRRLAGLTGYDLAGRAAVTLNGRGSLLSGAFDGLATVEGENLQTGVAALDGLLRGTAQITVSARRDEAGTLLRDLRLTASSLVITAKGLLTSTSSALEADLNFTDISVLGGPYRGALAGRASLTGGLQAGSVTLEASGTWLGIGQAEIDKIIGGQSRVTALLALTGDGVRIVSANLVNPQIEASATRQPDDAANRLTLAARLRDLAVIYPEFPGGVTATGTATADDFGTVIDLRVAGPAQIAARVDGHLAADFGAVNLVIRGTAQGALANQFLAPRSLAGPLRFDLTMVGPFALGSLNGPVTLTGGRLTDPSQGFVVQGIEGRADLANGQAVVRADAVVSSGGRLQTAGTVGLTSPYPARLTMALQGVTLRNPDLYEARGNGDLTIDGPLLGGALVAGRIALITTELRIPSTGLGGAGTLPDLRHRNEPGPVHDTRRRAGLIASGPPDAPGAGIYRLNLQLVAPNQVFIRGRGLDAELGGTLTLTGTTLNIIPTGSFTLIRGRLDILGRRLNLSEATLQMQGALVPFVRIAASVASEGITSTVRIEGPANDPRVSFTSTPELPEEEVLARLLFDQGLQNLSVLQAAQLAGAVATLAGRGSDGLIARLRQGSGLDNLDIRTDAEGTASVTIGKYLSDKAYTEVTVDQNGKSKITLNLDIQPHITLRGQVDSDGTAGVGIFLEKDY